MKRSDTHQHATPAARYDVKSSGVTQPRISDLMRGKVDLFSLDTLVDMATMAGLSLRIMIRKAA